MTSAEKYYNYGMMLFTQSKTKEALICFKKALEFDNGNEEYKIMKSISEYKLGLLEENPNIYYKKGLLELKNENYDNAKRMFKKALSIKKHVLYKEGLLVAECRKINIMNCSKYILLTLRCLDEIKVDCLLKSIEKGKIWYDAESFAASFNLQPHEMLEVQEKIIFPAKQKNTISRKIEF